MTRTSEKFLFSWILVMGEVREYLKNNRLPKHSSINKVGEVSEILVFIGYRFSCSDYG